MGSVQEETDGDLRRTEGWWRGGGFDEEVESLGIGRGGEQEVSVFFSFFKQKDNSSGWVGEGIGFAGSCRHAATVV